MAVSKEVADKEVSKWLDFKKVSQKKREEKEEQINSISEHIQDGVLVYDENTGELIHKLNFEISPDAINKNVDTVSFSEIKYSPRVKVDAIEKATNGIDAKNFTALIMAYVSAISGKPKKLIGQMDSSDYKVAQDVAIFFM